MINIRRKIVKKYVRLLDYFSLNKPHNFKHVPIIINNYNRLTMLRNLIAGLEKRGYHNIYIIDNCSTYPPLLNWMSENKDKYNFILLERNVGHLALFDTGLYKKFWHSYYIYTDPDLSIPEYVPEDFVEQLWNTMHRHRAMEKVGCALRIDDLPDYFENKQKVLDFEKRYWTEEISANVYVGGVDTTFALYPPLYIPYLSSQKNCRVAGNLTLKHEPWYIDSANLSEEEQYYISHCRTSTHWSGHK